MSFEYWIERRLSEETFGKISKRANFPMLAASFFGLIGLGGLVKAAVIGAPQINMDLLQIVASMGIGCFLAGRLTRKPIPEPK